MVCKRTRGGGKVGGPSSYNTLLSAPLAHWAIITSRSEKLCDFCCLLLSHFMLFAFFRIQLECIHCPCIKVLCRSSTFTNSLIIHVTRHMSALDQLKHSCTINRSGSFFPEHAGDRESVQCPEEFANF